MIKEKIIFASVVALILVELFIIQPFPENVPVTEPLSIPILNEINKDKTDFRIANLAMSTTIGASGYNWFSQLDIPAIKGGGGIWVNNYVQYLSIAQQTAPAKLFGILNGKYLIASAPIQDPDLELKGEFQRCENCPVGEAYGPFLYENRDVLPRAYVVDNSIVVIGSADLQDLSYQLLIGQINPATTVLIQGRPSVSDYSVEELLQFDSILLLQGSVDNTDLSLLQSYVDQMGIILPNILEGENSLTEEALATALATETLFKEVPVRYNSVNEFSVALNGEQGWLVLSEKVSQFPGWTATLNGKTKTVAVANIVISAIPLNGETGTLMFSYAPDSFQKGKTITILTVLLIVLGSGGRYFYRRRKWKSSLSN